MFVTLPDGSPAVGADVLVTHTRAVQDEVCEAQTDEKGQARLVLTPTASSRVMVSHEEAQPWWGMPLPINVRNLAVVVRLEEGLTIAGVVLDQHGELAPDVDVRAGPPLQMSLADVQQMAYRRATTDGNGRFVIRHLSPGDVTVLADPRNNQEQTVAVDAAAGDQAVRLQLRDRANPLFFVVDADSHEPPVTTRVEFVLLRENREPTVVYSWQSSDRAAPNAPGRATWAAWIEGWEHRYVVRVNGYRDSDEIVLDGSTFEGPLEVVVPMRRDDTFIGTLVLTVDVDGGELPSHLTVQRTGEGAPVFGDVVALDGREATLELPPGVYVFRVTGPAADLTASHPWLGATVVADVASGAQLRRDVLLRRGGFVRIRGAGAWPPAAPEVSYVSGEDDVGRAFVLGPLEPGPMTLDFGDEASAPRRVTVTIQPGEIVELVRDKR